MFQKCVGVQNTVQHRHSTSSPGGGRKKAKNGHFDKKAILLLVSIYFNLLNKILVTRSLETMCNFTYLTIYEQFRILFYFFIYLFFYFFLIEIACFGWVLAKKCKRPFLFTIKLTTKVNLTGV